MNSAVLFDIDGTLVDSVDLHAKAWQETLHHFGYLASFAEVRSQVGKGGDQLLPEFVPRSQLDKLEEEIEEFRSKLYKDRYMPEVKAFPRVRELFERVRDDGHRIALASSARGDELEHYKRLTRIEDLLDTATSADDSDRSKPFPDIFEAALARLNGVDRERVIAVGDSPYDAQAAGSAGLRTVGLLCGGFSEDTLLRAGCIALFQDPADLLDSYEHSPLALAAAQQVQGT